MQAEKHDFLKILEFHIHVLFKHIAKCFFFSDSAEFEQDVLRGGSDLSAQAAGEDVEGGGRSDAGAGPAQVLGQAADQPASAHQHQVRLLIVSLWMCWCYLRS